MKLKRVLIASFVLIVIGVLFILEPNAGVTGAVVGINSSIVNNESTFLFGFFLVWLAGIMLIGGVEEKVLSIEDLEKRHKQITDFRSDYGLSLYKGITEKLGKKKPSELKHEERLEVRDAAIKAKKESYLDFIGIKNQGNVYGKAALDDMHMDQAGLTSEDLNNLYSLTPESTMNITSKSVKNIEGRLNSYMFSDVKGKNYEGLKKELLEKLKDFNLDPEKIKGIQDVATLYGTYTNNKNSLRNYKSKDKKAA
jgi:hypothetical protein